MDEREQLRQAIQAQETLRGTLGDEVVDLTVAALKAKIDQLESSVSAHDRPNSRRHATVLFADVAGFTALSETIDAELVAGLMNELWASVDRVIERHGGEVDKHIGDAVMGVWGARTSLEHDPERAVRAGLDLVAAFEVFRSANGLPIAVRVGINTGAVVSGSVGTTGELSLTGDAVNIASRVEGLAPADSVLITHDTYRLVRGVFDLRPMAPVPVKGKADPIRTYLVEQAKRRSFRLPSRGVEGVETPMVGRDEEFGRLQDSFLAAARDRRARVVTVLGEPGAGKSRLLDEFTDWLDLRPEGIYFLKGRSVPETQGVPLGLLRELFAYRFDILDDAPRAEVATKLHGGFETISAREADVIGHWLGFDLDTVDEVRILADNGDLGSVAQPQLVRFLRAKLDEEPGVLLLEDVHWSDPASLAAVGHLAEQLRGSPLLVVAVARLHFAETYPDWPGGSVDTDVLRLEPLGAGDAAGLVRKILHLADDVPESVVDLVVAQADGNPFYVEELIKTLVEQEVVRPGEDGWTVSAERLGTIALPTTLAGVLQARLDALPPEEQAVVQHASVIGRTFWDDAVAALLADDDGLAGDVAGVAGEQVVPSLERLRARELVRANARSGFAGCDEFAFKHALLRDAAYDSVLLKDRSRLHGAAATWMEARAADRLDEHLVPIAEHLIRAGAGERAAPLLARAAAKASNGGSSPQAAALYERALECWDQVGDDRSRAACSARIDLGAELYRAGELGRAGDALRVAERDAAELGEPLLRSMALSQLSMIDLVDSAWEQAAERLDLAAALAEGEADGAIALAEALLCRSWLIEITGSPEAAIEPAREALELSVRSGSVTREMRAHNQLSICCGRIEAFAEAASHVDAGLAIARSIGDVARESMLLSSKAMLLHRWASIDGGPPLAEAIDLYEQVEATFERREVAFGLGGVRSSLAQARVEFGAVAEGRELALSCLRIARSDGQPANLVFAVVVLGQAMLVEGAVAEGLQMIGTAISDRRAESQDDEIARICAVHGIDDGRAAEGLAAGRGRDLDELVEQILARNPELPGRE